jgi:hypothetical protein
MQEHTLTLIDKVEEAMRTPQSPEVMECLEKARNAYMKAMFEIDKAFELLESTT